MDKRFVKATRKSIARYICIFGPKYHSTRAELSSYCATSSYTEHVRSRAMPAMLLLLVALIWSDSMRFSEASARESTDNVGSIKYAIYDTATKKMLSNGVVEKTLHISDIKIRHIDNKMCNKTIDLGNHFSFGLADADHTHHGLQLFKGPDGEKIDEQGYVVSGELDNVESNDDGFGLIGQRDDIKTFSWDWFSIDRPRHATKLQESGELSFDTSATQNRIEISHMKFLTDVSVRLDRWGDKKPDKPAWRIKIFKGSVITWPAANMPK